MSVLEKDADGTMDGLTVGAPINTFTGHLFRMV